MKIRHFFSTGKQTQLLCLLFTTLIAAPINAQQKVDLEVAYSKGQQYRVKSQIEHTGTVIVESVAEKSNTQTLPIDVRARLEYFERFVGSSTNPQSVRLYDQSQAKIQLGNAKTDSELDEKNQLVVVRIHSAEGNKFQIASVKDILQQRELELLNNPGDPLSFPTLLTKTDVEIDTEWEPGRESLARFLAVDHIIQSDVKLKLKETTDELAKIYIMGRVKAEVDDTITEMAVTAVLQINRAEKIVSALRLNIVELKKAAQIAPGFDGKTKVDLQVSLSDGVDDLGNDSLKQIAESRSIRNLLKWESYTGSFSLKYEPSWKMIASEDEAAVLRYVENGDLLAQCNIVRLASRPADKPLSLQEFQTEVTKVISKEPTSHVVSGDQSSTITGLKALRVTVTGIEGGVPMNWIYYNIASSDGRQVTFVFTLEQEIANRVDAASKKIINGFVFNAPSKKLKFDLQNSKSKANIRGAKADSDPIR